MRTQTPTMMAAKTKLPRPDMPTLLETLTDSIDTLTVGVLGDTIDYTPAGGTRRTIVAFVNHEEVRTQGGGIGVVGQDISVEAFMDAVPTVPVDGDRFYLPKYAGITFKPINGRLNAAGTGWLFELKTVPV